MESREVLIVGDVHGEWGRLNRLIAKKKPKVVLQVGDFGWWPAMEIYKPLNTGGLRKKKWTLKGVKPNGSKVYWCDGNHEEHPLLKQDGKVNEMYPGIFHCSRGSVIELNGKKILFAGGAYSIDKNMRTPGYDWFQEETIGYEDYDKMTSHDKVDIVISHTCPNSFKKELSGNFAKANDASREALEGVLRKYKPEQWFFGHWHVYNTGYTSGCQWTCLDYLGHIGRSWIWLREEEES